MKLLLTAELAKLSGVSEGFVRTLDKEGFTKASATSGNRNFYSPAVAEIVREECNKRSQFRAERVAQVKREENKKISDQLYDVNSKLEVLLAKVETLSAKLDALQAEWK